MVQPTLCVKVEKINVFKHYGQYTLYGSTISQLRQLYKNLLLPVSINHRKVKECPDCPYKTLYRQCHEAHQKQIHKNFTKEDVLYCYHCSYSTCLKNKLRMHMVSHQTKKTLECRYCGNMFKAKHSLLEHIKRMHNNKCYNCDTCSYNCKTKQGLVSHKQRKHVPDSDRKEEFSCTLCPFKTNKKWTLQYHMTSKHAKRFSCPKCTFITPLADSLENHKCKLYECNTCNYKTHRIALFKIHCTRHRMPEELPLRKCPICPFTTTSPSSFASHKNDHKNNYDLKCPKCQLIVKKKSLAQHIKAKHSKGKRGWYACTSCDYSSSNIGNLGRHIESKHTDKSNMEALKCGTCDFETKNKASLYMHNRYAHSDPNKHKCDQCAFTTVHKKNLELHVTIHGNRDKIACKKCSKTFLSELLVKAHFKRIHEIRRPYVCDLCPKEFQKTCKTKGDLRRHKLRHKSKMELETFKCFQCPYEAKIKSELVKHIRLIHTNNTNKYHICSKCYYRTKQKENLKLHIKEMHKSEKNKNSNNLKQNKKQ